MFSVFMFTPIHDEYKISFKIYVLDTHVSHSFAGCNSQKHIALKKIGVLQTRKAREILTKYEKNTVSQYSVLCTVTSC